MRDSDKTYGFSKDDASDLVQLIGGNDREYVEGRVRGGGGGASDSKIFLTDGSGITARSGTTVGSGTCTEFKLVSTTLTTNTNTVTVVNIWPFAIPANTYLLAVRERLSKAWVAVHPLVMNVRWVSPDLEQTFDGTNYVTIDTAEPCGDVDGGSP